MKIFSFSRARIKMKNKNKFIFIKWKYYNVPNSPKPPQSLKTKCYSVNVKMVNVINENCNIIFKIHKHEQQQTK